MIENLENQELNPTPTENQDVKSTAEAVEAHYGHEEENKVLNATSSEDEHEHHDEDFHIDQKSVEELYELVKDIIQNSLHKSAGLIKQIKSRFHELMREKEANAFEKFLEDGGVKEDFEFTYSKIENDLRLAIKEANDKLKQLRLKKEQEEQKNLSMKIDLIDDIKRLIEDGDISHVQTKFKEIQEKWNSIGHVPREKAEDLWNKYKHAVNMYYDALSIHRDLFKMELEKNLETKEQIVQKVENLLKMDSIKKSMEYLQKFHKEWRETGPIPKNKSEELWERFKKATEAVYKRSDEHFEKLKKQRKQNLEAKKKLLEEIEEWAAKEYKGMKEFSEAQKVLDSVEQRWRAIGRVPESVSEEIWAQFRAARKTLLSKRQHLWDELKSTWKENLAKKMALIEKAEELANSTDWKNTPAKFKKLQEEWKKIGAVQRDKSDAIWNRFRAAADTFFNAKEEAAKNIPIQEKENLEKKRAIIAEVEAYQPVEDIQANITAIDAFMKKFKSAGFVPMNEKQAVDQAFDAAIQGIWAKLNMDPSEKEKFIIQSAIDALLASSNPFEALKTERNNLRTRIEKIRGEVSQLESNLTFFNNSKNAEQLKKPYIDKIERFKKELTHLDTKLQLVRKAIKPFEEKK